MSGAMSMPIGPLLGGKRGIASRGEEFCGAAQFMSSFAAVQGGRGPRR